MADPNQVVTPVVRDYRPEDRAALEAIIRSCWTGIYAFFALRSLDSAPKILVAELDGNVIGFAEPRSERIGRSLVGNILWVAVRPDLRKRGVARQLVEECIGLLKGMGTGSVYVSIERDNRPSLEMFEKKGFARIGFSELAKQYGFRVLSFYSMFMIAPHEKVMVLNL